MSTLLLLLLLLSLAVPQGRPVYIQLLGKINMHKLKKVSTIDRLLTFHIHE